MDRRPHALGLHVLGYAVIVLAACQDPALEQRTYYSQRIAPILEENCVRGTADGLCHVESDESPGQALGNLDLSTFEAVHRRPELLASYGSYPEPVLLMKAVKPNELTLQYAGAPYDSEIVHAGGGILSASSEAFIDLQQWLRDGATLDGVPPERVAQQGSGPCSTALRPEVMPFLGSATGPAFDAFVKDVQPILGARCSYGSCHGSTQSDLYLTCGQTPEQQQHNFIVAQSFVSTETDRSELLLRPLAPNAGGVDHSGGDIWNSASDAEFARLRKWSELAGPLVLSDATAEFDYFAGHVMPALLRRGCAMPQCHSPQGFNDYRLRAGSRGFFSPLALRRNYDATLREFVSLDAADPNESRLLKKNVAGARGGIQHRAGIVLLDQMGADDLGNPEVCPAGQDEQPTSYCTVVEWIRRERAAALAADRVSALAEGDTVPVVYVDRPADPDRVIDFATFRGGAQLMRVDVTLGPGGTIVGAGTPSAIDLSGCGVGADLDIRGPEVSYDATQLAFALRDGEGDGLDIYVAGLDGSGCAQLTTDGQGSVDGVAQHNLDPVWVPVDAVHAPQGAIVYASTRAGRSGHANLSPRYRLPATNLWRMTPDGEDLGQMTFLNGSELMPAVMQNGQITMTTEKATESFYQLSGRRINWDLTDYHPLLAQRDSIGYGQATFVRESFDRDFLMIVSDPAARFSGGALVAFNRSLGPFEMARLGEDAYAPSLSFLDPAAANAGKGSATGAYRSPYPAPDGSVLVSYAAGTLDLTNAAAAVDYDLVVLDPVTGVRTPIAGGPGFQVDGVLVMRRSLRNVFVNLPQLVFGGVNVGDAAGPDEAWAHFPDLPMLATLLTDNHRGGRDLERLAAGDTLAVYAAAPPPGGDVDDGSTHQAWQLLGTHALADDGSAFVRVPAGQPLVLELRQGSTPLLTMTEEHQFGPGEQTSLGISRTFFDGVCGGCHGSIEGPELDVVVNPDALTGASVSESRPQPGALPSPF
ncbi:MAG: hypothetical protein IPH07_06205 [Deltaproteobacteria bacterium]|nr:hypothetical protein [Deltaproteobacteria bacterium]MBP7290806.1 hypothetical protein [Nannocystaceae bacterium]